MVLYIKQDYTHFYLGRGVCFFSIDSLTLLYSNYHYLVYLSFLVSYITQKIISVGLVLQKCRF